MLSGEILNIMERLTEQAHNSSILYAKPYGTMCRKRDSGAGGAPHTWAEGQPREEGKQPRVMGEGWEWGLLVPGQ